MIGKLHAYGAKVYNDNNENPLQNQLCKRQKKQNISALYY